MTYSFPQYTRNEEQKYGPTKQMHYYIPVDYHGRKAPANPKKTKWAVKENEQYEVFRIADESSWSCSDNNCLFSIINKGYEVLGENGERLGKFPFPPAPGIDWHGFPFHSNIIKKNSSFLALLDTWEENGIIESHVRRKIERGVI